MNADPRKGLPSASSFPRYSSCPGSFALEAQAPLEEPTQDALSGTRIHEALAGKSFSGLTDDEVDQVEICLRLVRETFDKVLGGAPDTVLREERLWLPDGDLNPVCSGQFDLFARRGNKVLLLDFKSGRDPVVAEESWQLRALVALAVENVMVEDEDELTAGIVQPWASPQTRLVSYDREDRYKALVDVRALVEAVQTQGQPRIPSEAACKYCRAKAICPETQALVTRLALTVLPDHRQGEILDPVTLASLLDRCSQAERVIAGIRSRAKHMLSVDPDSVPGWQLRPGAVRSKIVDLGGLWTRAAAKGISAEAFIAASSMTKTSLKSLLRSALALKGKGLDEEAKDLTHGLTEDKQAAPQLCRVGTTNEQIEEGEL